MKQIILHAHWEAENDCIVLVLTYQKRIQNRIPVHVLRLDDSYDEEYATEHKEYAIEEAEHWATEHHYTEILWENTNAMEITK